MVDSEDEGGQGRGAPHAKVVVERGDGRCVGGDGKDEVGGLQPLQHVTHVPQQHALSLCAQENSFTCSEKRLLGDVIVHFAVCFAVHLSIQCAVHFAVHLVIHPVVHLAVQCAPHLSTQFTSHEGVKRTLQVIQADKQNGVRAGENCLEVGEERGSGRTVLEAAHQFVQTTELALSDAE